MSDLNTETPFYFPTRELMNIETLISARIAECKQAAIKQPHNAHIHLESVPSYEIMAQRIRDEISRRFEGIRAHNNGALFTVNSDR